MLIFPRLRRFCLLFRRFLICGCFELLRCLFGRFLFWDRILLCCWMNFLCLLWCSLFWECCVRLCRPRSQEILYRIRDGVLRLRISPCGFWSYRLFLIIRMLCILRDENCTLTKKIDCFLNKEIEDVITRSCL